MTNPFTGVITTAFKTLFDNGIDAILENTALTVPCRMIYGGTRQTECPNCIVDTINHCSSNKYKAGGSTPFAEGSMCPVCNSQGFIPVTDTDTFNMAVLWNENRAKFINLGIKLDDNKKYAQSWCEIAHHPKLIRAKEAVLHTTIEGYGKQLYTREGDPTPFTFGFKTYIVTLWSRVN